jgi:hypothetical protein
VETRECQHQHEADWSTKTRLKISPEEILDEFLEKFDHLYNRNSKLHPGKIIGDSKK